jgi:hypothetical protein
MTRKPIQLVLGNDYRLYALCNDGTIWFRAAGAKEWLGIESPPQPEPSGKPLTSGEVREQMLRERHGVYYDRSGEL